MTQAELVSQAMAEAERFCDSPFHYVSRWETLLADVEKNAKAYGLDEAHRILYTAWLKARLTEEREACIKANEESENNGHSETE